MSMTRELCVRPHALFSADLIDVAQLSTIEAVRKAVGSDMNLMVDFNLGLLRSQASPIYNGMLRSLTWKADNPGPADGVHYNGSFHCAQGALVAVARKPRAWER